MFVDQLRNRMNDKWFRERLQDGGAKLRKTAEKLRENTANVKAVFVKAEKEEDPMVANVRDRSYAYWKKAWTGTLRSQTRRKKQ